MKTLVVLLLLAGTAQAQGLRLRGDALARSPSPVGLLVLQGEDHERGWLSAEALVWLADDEADALAISLRLRDPGGRGELRLGRQIFALGALRPLHGDGAMLRLRGPVATTAELFAGLPVVPDFGPRAYDWAVGGRLAARLGPGVAGLAWLERRDRGVLDTRELGGDLAVVPDGRWDLAAGAAVSLVDPGLAELRVSTSYRHKAWRLELFGVERSPSRLLPATSLFSVLGDVPSRRAGGVLRWRAAPRLDVWLAAGGQHQDDVGLEASTRAVLRLDESGEGRLGLELRRDVGWSGVRGTARVPLPYRLILSGEAELALVDDELWPWGLAALAWSAWGWEAAAAIEASSSPRDVYRVVVLARLSRAWELPR